MASVRSPLRGAVDMASLPTLYPNGALVANPALASGAYTDIDEGISGADGNYIQTVINWQETTEGYIRIPITNMPSDFSSMDTLSYQLRYYLSNRTDDTYTVSIQVFKSDASTALTNKMTAVSNPGTTGSFVNTSVVQFTGLDTSATKDDWDGALLVLWGWAARGKNPDNGYWRFDAVELTGTYSTASQDAQVDPATIAKSSSVNSVIISAEAYKSLELVSATTSVKDILLTGGAKKSPELASALVEVNSHELNIESDALAAPDTILLEPSLPTHFLSAGAITNLEPASLSCDTLDAYLSGNVQISASVNQITAEVLESSVSSSSHISVDIFSVDTLIVGSSVSADIEVIPDTTESTSTVYSASVSSDCIISAEVVGVSSSVLTSTVEVSVVVNIGLISNVNGQVLSPSYSSSASKQVDIISASAAAMEVDFISGIQIPAETIELVSNLISVPAQATAYIVLSSVIESLSSVATPFVSIFSYCEVEEISASTTVFQPSIIAGEIFLPIDTVLADGEVLGEDVYCSAVSSVESVTSFLAVNTITISVGDGSAPSTISANASMVEPVAVTAECSLEVGTITISSEAYDPSVNIGSGSSAETIAAYAGIEYVSISTSTILLIDLVGSNAEVINPSVSGVSLTSPDVFTCYSNVVDPEVDVAADKQIEVETIAVVSSVLEAEVSIDEIALVKADVIVANVSILQQVLDWFIIERKDGEEGSYEEIARTAWPIYSWPDTPEDLEDAHTYYYRGRRLRNGLYSPHTNIDIVTWQDIGLTLVQPEPISVNASVLQPSVHCSGQVEGDHLSGTGTVLDVEVSIDIFEETGVIEAASSVLEPIVSTSTAVLVEPDTIASSSQVNSAGVLVHEHSLATTIEAAASVNAHDISGSSLYTSETIVVQGSVISVGTECSTSPQSIDLAVSLSQPVITGSAVVYPDVIYTSLGLIQPSTLIEGVVTLFPYTIPASADVLVPVLSTTANIQIQPDTVSAYSSALGPEVYVSHITSTIQLVASMLGVGISCEKTVTDVIAFTATVLAADVTGSSIVEAQIINVNAAAIQPSTQIEGTATIFPDTVLASGTVNSIEVSTTANIAVGVETILSSLATPTTSVSTSCSPIAEPIPLTSYVSEVLVTASCNVYPSILTGTVEVPGTTITSEDNVFINIGVTNLAAQVNGVNISSTCVVAGTTVSCNGQVLETATSASNLVSPSVIQGISGVIDTEVYGNAAITTEVIKSVVQFYSVIVEVPGKTSAETIPVTASVLAPSVQATLSATIPIEPVASSATILPLTISVGDGVTPATIEVGLGVVNVSVSGSALKVLETIGASSHVAAPTFTGGARVTPTVISVEASVVDAHVSGSSTVVSGIAAAQGEANDAQVKISEFIGTEPAAATLTVIGPENTGTAFVDVGTVLSNGQILAPAYGSVTTAMVDLISATTALFRGEVRGSASVTPEAAESAAEPLQVSALTHIRFNVADIATAAAGVLVVETLLYCVVSHDVIEGICSVLDPSTSGSATLLVDRSTATALVLQPLVSLADAFIYPITISLVTEMLEAEPMAGGPVSIAAIIRTMKNTSGR